MQLAGDPNEPNDGNSNSGNTNDGNTNGGNSNGGDTNTGSSSNYAVKEISNGTLVGNQGFSTFEAAEKAVTKIHRLLSKMIKL